MVRAELLAMRMLSDIFSGVAGCGVFLVFCDDERGTSPAGEDKRTSSPGSVARFDGLQRAWGRVIEEKRGHFPRRLPLDCSLWQAE